MPATKRKVDYVAKVGRFFDTFSRIFLVHCDNVGSKQMANIRRALRGRAEVLMGKNTLMRKGISIYLASNPGHPCEVLLPRIRGNVGLIFTNDDLGMVRDTVEENRVPAPARAGAIAPSQVVVPAGPTGCDPGQTSFFQALDIATKISRGQVEIVNNVTLIEAGDKVTPGQSALLSKLSIRPFTYGMRITAVYDNGSLFDAAVLDLTTDAIASKFTEGVRRVAAVSMELGMPTLASVPHSLVRAMRMLIAICADDSVTYSFAEAKNALAYLADPSAFAAAAGAAGGDAGDAGAAAAPVEEEEEEVDANVGGLFGDDDGEAGY